MKRFFAIGLIITLGNAPAVFAGEPLLVSATRLAQEVTATQASPAKSDPAATRELGITSFAKAAGVGAQAPLAQQGGGTVSSTGMKRSTKTLIFAGVAGAFLGIAVGIDHSVKNVTPSSLGERHDDDVFKK